MPKYVVEGGVPLRGTIRPAGNKNAALPILAACLLTDEAMTLENVPDIRDVRTLAELLGVVGAQVSWAGPNEVTIRAADVHSSSIDAAMAARIRASILLVGP